MNYQQNSLLNVLLTLNAQMLNIEYISRSANIFGLTLLICDPLC